MNRKTILSVVLVFITLNKNQFNCVAAYENNSIQKMRAEFEEYKCLIEKYNLSRSFYKNQRELKNKQINLYSIIVHDLENCTKMLEDRVAAQQDLIVVQNQNRTKLDNNFSRKTQELTQLNEALHSKTQQLTESETQIASINQTIVNLNETLGQKEIEIVELKKQLELFKSVNQTNTEQLLANSLSILNLDANITRSSSTIEELNQKITQLHAQGELDDRLISSLKATAEEHLKCCKATSCEPFGSSTDVHSIYVPDFGALQVLCNGQLAGPGWTVIQSRSNGSVDFYRDWQAYKNGFGSLTGEFFIGLEQLHYMTRAAPQELYIHLEDFDGETRYAKYDDFKVGTEQEQYALKSLGSYSGTVEDTMRRNEGQKFSTSDKDNDNEPYRNCARILHGAWWYNSCGLSNLNGRYLLADSDYEAVGEGIFWDSDWHDYEYSLKSVQMLIRPKK